MLVAKMLSGIKKHKNNSVNFVLWQNILNFAH